MHMQDALSVLQLAGEDKASLPVESVEALAEIALYVDRRFAVWPRCQNTKVQSLELVGAGIDDDFIYVFQEMQLTGQLHELVFTSTLLQDIEPYAASFVNLLTPAGQFTYQFAQESPNQQPEVVHLRQHTVDALSHAITPLVYPNRRAVGAFLNRFGKTFGEFLL